MKGYGTLSKAFLASNVMTIAMYKTQVQMNKRLQHKTILNLLEQKVGSTLECTGTGDHFLNIIPVAQTVRVTINKWDLLKLRSLCEAKDTVNKTKKQPKEWKKIFNNPTQTED